MIKLNIPKEEPEERLQVKDLLPNQVGLIIDSGWVEDYIVIRSDCNTKIIFISDSGGCYVCDINSYKTMNVKLIDIDINVKEKE